jgi:hypothetical protein
MKIIVRTEVWSTSKGKVVKAVVRETNGTFIGATNQTGTVKAARTVRPRVSLVGAK